MSIRSAAAALALGGALFAAAPASAQVIMSLNHVATNGLPFAECMRRAQSALQQTGLLYHDTTSQAVWGRTGDGRYMVSFYCLTTRDVVVLAAAGPEGSGTRSLVDRLLAAWNQTY
ncbi:MAG: hypothetical protein KIT16_03905 [Rhodospirillaceae bacterium]|nr:hypothetical protein [Rhodospirillaceae bacterium]